MKQKKGIMNQIVSIFVLVLVISVLSGLTFLFGSQLLTQVSNVVSTDASTARNSTAYQAVNQTMVAGYAVVGYLGLIFMVLIFSALLALVLRMIIPYMNLGQGMTSF
jgi:hypothetical protein